MTARDTLRSVAGFQPRSGYDPTADVETGKLKVRDAAKAAGRGALPILASATLKPEVREDDLLGLSEFLYLHKPQNKSPKPKLRASLRRI